MNQIAGLQDFRKQGPPADIGTFQGTSTIIVFPFTFSGTAYYVAMRSGPQGWVLVSYGADASTVINAAMVALPAAGGTVILREGLYVLTATLAFPDDRIILSGSGWSTVLQNSLANTINIIAHNECIVENLMLDMIDNWDGVWLQGSDRNIVRNVYFYNDFYQACNVESSSYNLFQNCFFDGNDAGDYAIVICTDTSDYNTIDNCTVQNLDDYAFEVTFGIENTIKNNRILNLKDNQVGILIGTANSTGNKILHNYITEATNTTTIGIQLSNSHRTIVAHNVIITTSYCIESSEDGTLIEANIFRNLEDWSAAITLGNDRNTIIGNYFYDCAFTAIEAYGANSVVKGNLIYNANTESNAAGYGIDLGSNPGNMICEGNLILDDRAPKRVIHGISVGGTTDYNTITDNFIFGVLTDGIRFASGSLNNVIEGNTCRTGGGNGITLLANNDDCILTGNRCTGFTGYGIRIQAATCERNLVKDNILSGNTAGSFADAGTNTKLAVIHAEFTYWGGGSGGYTTPGLGATPGGIDIDANDELAVSHRTLPLEVQQVVRIKIWGYSNVIEATNNMLLRIIVNGGTGNEQWNTNNIDVINHPSEETGGIVVSDVLHWMIDAGDDADIGNIIGGDLLEILAVGEAAVAPDIATDALFGAVEIEYV